jgi:hypothetical protein
MKVTALSVPVGDRAVQATVIGAVVAMQVPPGAVPAVISEDAVPVLKDVAMDKVLRCEAPGVRVAVTGRIAGVEEKSGIGVPDPSP